MTSRKYASESKIVRARRAARSEINVFLSLNIQFPDVLVAGAVVLLLKVANKLNDGRSLKLTLF